MSRRSRLLIFGSLGAVAMVVALAAVLLARFDPRQRVESFVSTRLGRKLTIEGLSIGWGDPIRLDLTGLRLANPAWGSTPDMVAIGHLRAELAPWPLLHGGLVLSHVVVENPVIVLERDPQGNGNWVFPSLGPRPAGAPRPPAPPPVELISALHLRDGDLSFRTTEHHLLRIHVASADLAAADADAPVSLHAVGSYNDLPLVADVTLESFAALHRLPMPVATRITVAAKQTRLELKGTMTDPLGFDGIHGHIDLVAQATRELARVFEIPDTVPGKLALSGMLDKQGDRWRVTGLNGGLADTTVAGKVGLDEGARGSPDHFDLNLDFAALDLRRLAGGAPSKPAEKGISLRVDEHPTETYAIRIGVRDASYGRYRLTGLGIEATVEPARIAIARLSFGFADGEVALSGSNEAAGAGGHLRADATLARMNATKLIAMLGGDTAMLAGKLNARATLDMTGATVQQGLGASRGQAVLSMTGGQVSRQFLQLASIDLRLLLRKGEGFASVGCFLAVADMRNGVASVAPLRLRTREGNLFGGGVVDFRRDALDLYVQSEGKSTRFWALDIPLHITGSLTNPQANPMVGSKAPSQGARGAENLRRLPPELRRGISCGG